MNLTPQSPRNHQPRPLFVTDAVTWLSSAYKLKKDRTWRPGVPPNQDEPVIAEARFQEIRVVSRATVRHGCREGLAAMMARLASGVPARSRKHGRMGSVGRFHRRWRLEKMKAMPRTSEAIG
jgi:hypothetical protein